MNKKYIKIALIGAGSLIGAFIVYKGIKKLIDLRNSADESPEVSDEKERGITIVKTFTPTRKLSKGSKDSGGKTEVGAIQLAFNNIINDMKGAVTPVKTTYVSSNDALGWSNPSIATSKIKSYVDVTPDSSKEARRKQIASLKKLDVDGDFGNATEKVAKVILGKTTFTYNDVKQKRIDLAKAYNLKKPY